VSGKIRRLPRLPGLQSHICVDVRQRAVYWVLAEPAGSGLSPARCGAIPIDEGGGLEEALGALARVVGRSRLEVVVDAPGLVQRREPLPAMSRRDAARVAERRRAEVEAEVRGSASFAWSRGSTREAGPLWLFGAPEDAAGAALDAWEERGFEVHRLSARHFALGSLARLLPPPPEDSLFAIFDLEASRGTCVVCDADGWAFSREVQLRFMGDRMLRKQALVARPPEPPPSLEGGLDWEVDEEPSGLELAAPSDDEPGELDPLETVAEQAERLGTELRRTFTYVQGQLGLGRVGRVYLSGEAGDLRGLTPAVSGFLGMPVEVLVDALPRGPLRGAAPGATVAIGLAASPDRRGGNLVPESTRWRRACSQARSRLATAAASALALLVVLGGFRTVQALQLHHELTVSAERWQAEAGIREEMASAHLARERVGALRALRGEIEAEPPWAVLLDVLGRLEPAESYVAKLRAKRGEQGWQLELVVDGRGPGVVEAARSISELARQLDASPLADVSSVERVEDFGALAG
jgi:hypothetical protein